ncbi:uncharacterized protein LOC132705899 [Cylas formicarius]|uniref:uncharacterized protein LOC132705899 n=1 Tax=Cylas formicarius TaxID=197179 RepID=UPI002958736F|nr:uncharacterized protein LOC132705899 [Cylas formicarius]
MCDYEVDAQLLISLVEQHAELWDNSSEYYKHKQRTEAAWNDVCRVVFQDFDILTQTEKMARGKAVRRKWANIRDSWMRYLRKVTEDLECGMKPPKKYLYHDQLLFLTKNGETPTFDTVKTEIKPDFEESLKSDEFEESVDSLLGAADVPRISKQRKIDTGKETLLYEKQLYLEENRHISFFKSILPSINNFNEDQVIDFQMGVMKLIKDIKASGSSQTS